MMRLMLERLNHRAYAQPVVTAGRPARLPHCGVRGLVLIRLASINLKSVTRESKIDTENLESEKIPPR
jgi:hypothetical protein